MPLLLISGRPGAGKTAFCEWLATEHGYVSIETDQQWTRWGPWLDGDDQGQWVATKIRNDLRQEGPNVAFEWGFSPELLYRVRQLRFAGVEPWWFDGDESECRKGWERRRPTSPIELYEIQVTKIQEEWSAIERAYRGRIIQAVSPGPTYLSFQDIFARIQKA